ncbi:MAG: LPS export ABC transporter permease LptF [Acidiferrobacterales bacterium]
MVIKRAFYREATLTTLAVALVLVVLFLFLVLTKLLGKAAIGEYASGIVFILLGLELGRRLEILIPLALYLGVLFTLARWYRDSEMTVLAACGVGLPSLCRPVIVLAICFAVVVGVFSLYLSPKASALSEQARSDDANRTTITSASAGVFTELRDSGRIFYAEKIGAGPTFEYIFANDRKAAKQNILVASSGEQYQDSLTREEFLVLKNGSIYEGTAGEPDYRITKFDNYRLRLVAKEDDRPATEVEGLPSWTLLKSSNPRHAAEFQWRLAKPISVVLLAVLALVLAHTDARRGRVGNMLGAILIYFVYTNMLGIGETWLKDGSVPTVIGLWWVHGALAIIIAYLLMRRVQNKPLLALWS